MGPVRRHASQLLAAVTVAAGLSVAACSSSTPVPKGYLQLHFNIWPKPWTTASVPVGTYLAVRAINGDKAPPATQDSAVVQQVAWTVPPSPPNWHAFEAVSPGTASIREILPCKGTACTAGEALIEITVTPTSS